MLKELLSGGGGGGGGVGVGGVGVGVGVSLYPATYKIKSTCGIIRSHSCGAWCSHVH
jgi:hypothetical protein